MAKFFLDHEALLVRTDTGVAAMRDRTSGIAPKLRAVLFLVDGQHTAGQLLDRAGSLSDLLESQLKTLIQNGYVSVRSESGPASDSEATATLQSGRRHAAKAADLPPVVAAKMQLLLRLESIDCDQIDLLGAELIDSKTLRDLATNAKMVSIALEPLVGVEVSQKFWSDAKEILVAWRDISNKST